MYIEAFFGALGLAWLLSLSGTVVGLFQAWRGGGPAWSWKRSWLLIVSAIFLAAVVAFSVFLFISSWDIPQ